MIHCLYPNFTHFSLTHTQSLSHSLSLSLIHSLISGYAPPSIKSATEEGETTERERDSLISPLSTAVVKDHTFASIPAIEIAQEQPETSPSTSLPTVKVVEELSVSNQEELDAKVEEGEREPPPMSLGGAPSAYREPASAVPPLKGIDSGEVPLQGAGSTLAEGNLILSL